MFHQGIVSLAISGMSLCGAAAHADAWPSQTIRIVVPAAPGGSADPLARLVAEELSTSLNQSLVVENKPGANGNIAVNSVVRASPDGHTLLFGWTGTLVPAVTMYNAEPYHPQRDLDPIVLIGSVPNVIVVQPSIGVRTFADLVETAKTQPGKLNFGSTGSGSSYHLSGELYKKVLGVSMTHVPYSSPGAVFADLLGDRLQLAFPGVTAAAPFVKDGRLTAVAVMADQRSNVLPGVPTTAEVGQPDLKSETWFALLSPRNTPADIRQKVNDAVNAALKKPDFRNKIIELGFTPLGGSGEDLAKTLDDDIRKWGEIVTFAGAKVD